MAPLLIVDDEPIGESLAVAFRHAHYDVTLARTSGDARRQLEQRLFDIVVCDITLPDANGLELLEFVRQVSPESVFLLMTGKEHAQEIIVRALNLGADRYIVKSDREIKELESSEMLGGFDMKTMRLRDFYHRAARE